MYTLWNQFEIQNSIRLNVTGPSAYVIAQQYSTSTFESLRTFKKICYYLNLFAF